jgi:hypothetical protein
VDSDYLFGNSSNSESLRRVSRRLLQLAWEAVIHPSWSAASRVPSTRERIFAKAVSRAVERSSPKGEKGEKPQSSVVPSSSSGMNSDASSTRSLTSWGVSTF